MSDTSSKPKASVFSLRYWSEMSNESMPKIILISVGLCIVCSFFVSMAAINLSPLKEANKLNSKRKNIVQVAGLADKPGSLTEVFDTYIEQRLVDIEAGTFARDIEAERFEAMVSTDDADLSRKLTGDEDLAKIAVRENYAITYLVKNDAGVVEKIILPVRGYGLWSTMYGFVAVDSNDANTILALQFYDQAETPGLGAEVDNPRWRALWGGKEIFEGDEVKISVLKGDQAQNKYGVDALSGATLTSRGVHNLMQFWMGPLGFQPLLKNLSQQL